MDTLDDNCPEDLLEAANLNKWLPTFIVGIRRADGGQYSVGVTVAYSISVSPSQVLSQHNPQFRKLLAMHDKLLRCAGLLPGQPSTYARCLAHL